MLFKFPKEKIDDEIFTHIKDRWYAKVLYWVIDWRYRTAIHLTNWMSSFNYTVLADVLKEIPDSEEYDEQVIHCLRWVKNNITYTTDLVLWDTDEKWQTIEETLSSRRGDCEDGAILLYWLCRYKGVPSDRIFLMAGDVNGGGHCWLAYKPQEYPLNWVFLDWCYWYNANGIGSRDFFYINNKNITAFNPTGSAKNTNYYNIWFVFNEEDTYTEIVF